MKKAVRKKITSQDVAKAAGVSQTTVSMILNGKMRPSFSDKTVRRVLEAADQLGYQSFREKNASLCGLILIICPVLSNPYYASMAQAVEQAAYKNGFRSMICTTYRNKEIESRHINNLDPAEIAGIVFASIPLHVRKVEEINQKIPVVVIGDRNDMIDVDTVEVNSYRSGVTVAKYLLSLGHRNIAFISTSLDNANTIRIKRLEGVRDTLKNSELDSRFIVKSQEFDSITDISNPNIEHEVGYTLTGECLADQEVTAIIGVNDMVAYGAMDALLEAGYKIPEDYSVCGFDNIFPSQMRRVSLSSIENYMTQKGHDAFDILMSRMKQRAGQNKDDRDSITRVEYQPHLIIRSSTGPAKK